MTTRDRVRLDADVYYPDGDGEFPVLLMRQPYGRAIASTVVYAHPVWYAAHGYIVVIQDVRGRGTSEGEFVLFEHEIEDGYDSVNWAASLPQSSGSVGMYGFSYQGMTQLYAAIAQPPALKALCPAMLAGDVYHDWAYEGGAFCWFANLAWAIQLAAETARLKGDETAFSAFAAASRNLPFYESSPALPKVMQEFSEYDSFYQRWLNCSDPEDPYWKKISPIAYLDKLNLPMLHIGGWFDTYLRGTLNFYKAMQQHSSPQSLIVGPWAHLPWGRKVGAIDYGNAAVSPCDVAQLRWFDRFLKGIETPQEMPIKLFEMGSNQWKLLDRFPNHEARSLYLSSTGRAAIDETDGKLSPTLQLSPSIPDAIVHDPWRPVPASGGHASYPCGSSERAALDTRSDILTYTTEVLTEAIELCGEIYVELYCKADQPSFDVCVVLSEVKSNGSVVNISQGYYRSHQPSEMISIALQPTCIAIAPGSALRISISAACFPAFWVNPGNGKARSIDAQLITLRVRSGESFRSRVVVPTSSLK